MADIFIALRTMTVKTIISIEENKNKMKCSIQTFESVFIGLFPGVLLRKDMISDYGRLNSLCSVWVLFIQS